ncbi:MAG: MFS transporter [Anaerolineales bacterium]|nr:MFS transporter [Anaerolineales bacterium]
MQQSSGGMREFTILWLGQIVSMLGSAMTWFAFTIWAWEKTGQATALAFISFFTFLPAILFTPIAGALVDRWNRKWVMVLSDMATALGTLAALILYLNNGLEIWHVYVIGALTGFFTAFQYPAYNAAVTTMLAKEQYTRAEGMLGLIPAVSTVFGPMFGAVLLNVYDMAFIMTVDLITFLAAFGTLLWVHIPQPKISVVGAQSRGSLWQETLFGFGYIRKRAGLFSLIKLFMAVNFFLAIGATLMAPMILSKSVDNELALATVQTVGALGGIAGGVSLSIWGGPKLRIHGILIGGAGACLFGIVWLGLSSQLLFWAIGSFFFAFFEPFVEGINLSIWQSKVEADVQGRVLSARHLMVQIPYLLGVLASGLLAEKVMTPLLKQDTLLARWLGSESGAGMSLLLVLAGISGAIIFLFGYVFRNIREIDSLTPDLKGE